jgi:hypothetical protein
MSDYLIVVVNRALARFFTLEPVEFPELESGPIIKEGMQLANPDIGNAQELFTDSKTGCGAAPQGAGVHGYEDHRDQHLDEVRRRFSVSVVDRIRKLAKHHKVRTIVLASSARMRRFLYQHTEALERQGYRMVKVPKNMINFTPQKIHKYLAGDRLIPGQEMAP